MGWFAGMMLQSFGLAAYSSTDARGRETFGTPAQYACRYQPLAKLLTSTDGQRVLSTGVIYTERAVSVLDRVWPPGANTANLALSRKPISVATHYDLESGQVDHFEVVF
jgi:hypothetical protein